jgi:FkbM family methyltransferase
MAAGEEMKSIVKSILGAIGYQVQSTRYCPRQLLQPAMVRAVELDDVICRRMIEHRPELVFIQVGVFDGVIADPLHKYIGRHDWRGVLVEPQARAAGQLRDRYRGNDRIAVLQAALDSSGQTRTLFTIASGAAPAWAGGMASFDRRTISKHSDLIPGLETMIGEETVKCVSFDDVFRLLPAGGLDLLQIDTEGADAHILSMFPFDRVRPAIIHWEVKHLNIVQQEETLGMLSALGYRFARSGGEDMLAVLRD